MISLFKKYININQKPSQRQVASIKAAKLFRFEKENEH